MKPKRYLLDKVWLLIILLATYLIILLFLFAYKIPNQLILTITILLALSTIAILLIDYFRKRKFYTELTQNTELLDKKYLVLETLTKPSFYEGELTYQAMYEINKSMLENVHKYEYDAEDFKEYVEMWIHEVKIPISSLTLMCHNHKEQLDKSYLEQLRKLDNYIDQILYYVRSNYTEKDFLIKEVNLDKIISSVALKNKDDLLENKIDLIVETEKCKVNTDSKWLEFILNQIINNSIKYKSDQPNSYIKIFTEKQDRVIKLHILDNGIGISKNDLPQIFKKTYTGENGQNKAKSTGMGLYIADKLCKQLGHKISATSKKGEYTEITITFGQDDFYKLEN